MASQQERQCRTHKKLELWSWGTYKLDSIGVEAAALNDHPPSLFQKAIYVAKHLRYGEGPARRGILRNLNDPHCVLFWILSSSSNSSSSSSSKQARKRKKTNQRLSPDTDSSSDRERRTTRTSDCQFTTTRNLTSEIIARTFINVCMVRVTEQNYQQYSCVWRKHRWICRKWPINAPFMT